MTTLLVDTVSGFLENPKNVVTDSGRYNKLVDRVQYFEDFSREHGFPDLVGLICDFIQGEYEKIEDPVLTFAKYGQDEMLVLKQFRSNTGYALHMGLRPSVSQLEFSAGLLEGGDVSRSEVKIKTAGYGTFHGDYPDDVVVSASGLRKKMAQHFLDRNFQRVSLADRSEVMLQLAKAKDRIYCDGNARESHVIGESTKGYTPFPWTDQHHVYLFEKEAAGLHMIGASSRQLAYSPGVDLSFRIHREEKPFKFPV